MIEKKVVELEGGTKVHMTFEALTEGRLNMTIEDIEPPKKPAEYRYSKVGLPNIRHQASPIFWRKNKDGLPIYLKLVRYVDHDAKGATALVMCDTFGDMLESGCLLKFDEETGAVNRVPMVSDQYPGELFPDHKHAMVIGILPIVPTEKNA